MWRVMVEQRRYINVEIRDAETWSDARRLARERYGLEGFETSVHIIAFDGEPWVTVRWLDHHRHDLVLAERAHGHRFTAAEIDLIRDRLKSVGLTVVDEWNGAGVEHASFVCEGRNGRAHFTVEQTAILEAPRPSGAEPTREKGGG